MLDSLTSSTHFAGPAAFGLALAGAPLGLAAAASLTAFLLWGMASHAFGAVQDVQPDREAGIGSWKTVTAKISCTVGVMYWSSPVVVSGTRAAAPANSSRGTAVTTPALASRSGCQGASVENVPAPPTSRTTRATSAAGARMSVSAVSDVSAPA